MSIYKQCSAACDALMTKGGIFTEVDVVIEAGKRAKWKNGSGHFRDAMRVANQVLGTKYRERKLARYGPIAVPGMPEPDYARIASKIAYTSAIHGPESFECPNGTFPRLMIEKDNLTKQGRRYGTNRDDHKPWDEQNLLTVRSVASTPKELELQANLDAAHTRIKTLEAELERLRSMVAERDGDAVQKELDELKRRISVIEDFSPAA